MSNTIKLKRGSGSDPSASDLVVGEVAVRTDSGKLFTKKDDNSVTEIGGGSGVIDDGSITNAKVASDAAIAGTKIAPNFGSQNVQTSGYIQIQNTNPTLHFTDTDNDDDFSIMNRNGLFAVRDETDGVDRFTIGSDGNIQIPNDSVKLQIGASQDLEFFHDSSSSYIQNDTGNLIFKNASSNYIVNVNSTGAVELNYNGSKKQATVADGVDTFNRIRCLGGTPSIHLNPDATGANTASRAMFGLATGANHFISGAGPNDVVVNTPHRFLIGHASSEIMAIFDPDGASELYFDAAKKFSTSSTGVDITGNITVSGTVDGVDVAALNTAVSGLSSGSAALTDGVTATTQGSSDNTTKVATTAYVTTAISNLINNAPSALDTLKELSDALGSDANFSTTVTNSIATKLPLAGGTLTGNLAINTGNSTNDLSATNIFRIMGNDVRITNAAGSEGMIFAAADGAVSLFHGMGSGTSAETKLATTSTGVSVTGQITTTSHVKLPDSAELKLGSAANGDFALLHNGTDSILNNATGHLLYRSATHKLQSLDATDRLVINSDGHVDVTGNLDVGAGLDVTGATTLLGDGNASVAWGDTSALGHLSFTATDGNPIVRALTGKALVFQVNQSTTAMTLDSTGRILGDTISLGGTGTTYDALFEFSNNTAYSASGTNAKVAIGNANSTAATNSTGIHMFTDGNGRGIVNLNACNNSTNASADFVVQTRHSGTLGERLRIKSNGTVDIAGNLDVGAGIDVTGNITVSGTVDGVDIAARNTLFGGLTSSSGVLTNGVTATTQSAGDNSTKVATTAYTDTAISNLVDSSPSTLNTLNELAAALGDDANFSTTVTNSIATKMPLAGGEFTGNITTHDVIPDSNAFRNIGTSSVKFNQVHATTFHGSGANLTNLPSQTDNNFTDADHSKLDGIESGATADQTASEILTLIKTVDGAGSGLDADTLDGISSASFLRSDANDNVGGTLTFVSGSGINLSENDIYLNGRVINNQKSGSDGLYIGYNNANSGATRIYGGGTTSGGLVVAGNGANNLTFNSNKVFHAGNDGSGSGLDADTVDGIEGSNLLRADTDDTTSGSITFANDGDGIITNGAGRFYKKVGTGMMVRLSSGGQQLQVENNSGTVIGTFWHSGNDGAGTGLDADLLDGQHGSYYLDYNNFSNTPTIPTNNNQLSNGAGYITSANGGNADQVDGLHASSFLRSDTADGAGGDITFSGGAGAVTINSDSDIRFSSGDWTGESCKIQQHSNSLYIQAGSNSNHSIIFRSNGGSDRWYISDSGTLYPATDNAHEIGTSSNRVQNIYMAGGIYLGGTGSNNYLNDYEEGTWSPTLRGGSNNAGGYSIQSGSYTKVGRKVTVSWAIAITSKASMSGDLHILGLPFGVASNITGSSIESSGICGFWKHVSPNLSHITCVADDADAIYLRATSGAEDDPDQLTASDIDSDFTVRGTVTYFAS